MKHDHFIIEHSELRREPRAFRQGLLAKYGPKIFEDHADLLAKDPPPDHLELHVTTLLLNKEIAVVGMPGEPFVNFQMEWRRVARYRSNSPAERGGKVPANISRAPTV